MPAAKPTAKPTAEPTDDPATAALRAEYRTLIHETLPAEIHSPVRLDHCFARCALDWLFQDVWYDHLPKPAWKHLTRPQLERLVPRLHAWRADRSLLEADNAASLRWRGKGAS